MTRPTRRRPPTGDYCRDLIGERPTGIPGQTTTGPLRAIVDLFADPALDQVLAALAVEANPVYGARAPGAGVASEGGNQVDEDGQPIQAPTPVERHALDPDRTAQNARHLLDSIHLLGEVAAAVERGLAARHPSRTVRLCPRCQHPLEPGTGRCQQIVDPDTGRRCETSEEAWPLCLGCGEPMPPGERRQGRCDRCRKHVATHGYDRASMASYRDRMTDIVATDGTYTTPDPPTAEEIQHQ